MKGMPTQHSRGAGLVEEAEGSFEGLVVGIVRARRSLSKVTGRWLLGRGHRAAQKSAAERWRQGMAPKAERKEGGKSWGA